MKKDMQRSEYIEKLERLRAGEPLPRPDGMYISTGSDGIIVTLQGNGHIINIEVKSMEVAEAIARLGDDVNRS